MTWYLIEVLYTIDINGRTTGDTDVCYTLNLYACIYKNWWTPFTNLRNPTELFPVFLPRMPCITCLLLALGIFSSIQLQVSLADWTVHNFRVWKLVQIDLFRLKTLINGVSGSKFEYFFLTFIPTMIKRTLSQGSHWYHQVKVTHLRENDKILIFKPIDHYVSKPFLL